jgi:hypothetical protein
MLQVAERAKPGQEVTHENPVFSGLLRREMYEENEALDGEQEEEAADLQEQKMAAAEEEAGQLL